jgi:hypothetical protein
MKNRVTAALALLVACVAAPAPAFAWDVIGSRDVASRVDHDAIHLDGHRQFSRIRICVAVNPVHFMDVTVNFNNGGSQTVPIRSLIKRGGCSRVIELNGAPRDISEIKFVYQNATARWRNARVVVSAE